MLRTEHGPVLSVLGPVSSSSLSAVCSLDNDMMIVVVSAASSGLTVGGGVYRPCPLSLSDCDCGGSAGCDRW